VDVADVEERSDCGDEVQLVSSIDSHLPHGPHTPPIPAYVSARQHTPAYARISQHTSACQHASAYVSIRQHGANTPRIPRSIVDPIHLETPALIRKPERCGYAAASVFILLYQ
jgi:hypothetical protein